MTQNKSMTINRIPAPTYRWLHMNEARTEAFSGGEAGGEKHIPEGVVAEARTFSAGTIPTGVGSELDSLMEAAGSRQDHYLVPAGSRIDDPLRLSYQAGSEDAVAPVSIEVEQGARCTVIVWIGSEGEGARLASQIRARIGQGASLRLVEVVYAPKSDIFCDIGIETEEKGSFELVQLFLAAAHTFSGTRCELVGDGSSMEADIAYRLGRESLDMNYIANHRGKKTTSRMDVAGVLGNGAEKLFRGTIDFKRGAKGAVGNEQEDALLLDKDVVNRTIPLILCAEEDVEGNHGATIGRLGEDLLFYLQSRGMNTEQIYEMMARARIDAVANRIGDAETQEAVQGLL